MKTKQMRQSAKSYLATFCFWGMMILVPLYYHYAYFDMIEAKARALRLVLYVALAGGVILTAATVIGRKEKIKRFDCFCSLDYAMCAFAITIFLSWMLCGDKAAAFWGNLGWSTGAFVLMGCVCCYFLLAGNLPESQNLWLPVLLVNIVIFGTSVLHSMKIDVLSLHENIRPDQWYQYFSTMGQTNAQMGYLALIFPVFAVFFVVSSERISTILYAIVVVLGEMAIILCGSDGIYVAIGGCMFFLLPFVWKDNIRMARFLEMMAVFGIVIMLVSKTPLFAERLEYMEGLARAVAQWQVGLVLCLGAAVLACAMAFLTKKHAQQWKCLLYVFEAGMTVFVAAMFAKSVVSYQKVAAWGSGRKYLWSYSVQLFGSLPLKDKLFGVGPEMLGSYYEACQEYFGETVLTAHSEFLQYLLTTGIVGVIAWLAICISVVYTYFKYRSEEKMTIAYFLAMAAYFIQALIINPQPLTAAVCCVMLACYRRSLAIDHAGRSAAA